jgi:hypothetical protein
LQFRKLSIKHTDTLKFCFHFSSTFDFIIVLSQLSNVCLSVVGSKFRDGFAVRREWFCFIFIFYHIWSKLIFRDFVISKKKILYRFSGRIRTFLWCKPWEPKNRINVCHEILISCVTYDISIRNFMLNSKKFTIGVWNKTGSHENPKTWNSNKSCTQSFDQKFYTNCKKLEVFFAFIQQI